jgi:hypothetical protein
MSSGTESDDETSVAQTPTKSYRGKYKMAKLARSAFAKLDSHNMMSELAEVGQEAAKTALERGKVAASEAQRTAVDVGAVGKTMTGARFTNY